MLEGGNDGGPRQGRKPSSYTVVADAATGRKAKAAPFLEQAQTRTAAATSSDLPLLLFRSTEVNPIPQIPNPGSFLLTISPLALFAPRPLPSLPSLPASATKKQIHGGAGLEADASAGQGVRGDGGSQTKVGRPRSTRERRRRLEEAVLRGLFFFPMWAFSVGTGEWGVGQDRRMGFLHRSDIGDDLRTTDVRNCPCPNSCVIFDWLSHRTQM